VRNYVRRTILFKFEWTWFKFVYSSIFCLYNYKYYCFNLTRQSTTLYIYGRFGSNFRNRMDANNANNEKLCHVFQREEAYVLEFTYFRIGFCTMTEHLTHSRMEESSRPCFWNWTGHRVRDWLCQIPDSLWMHGFEWWRTVGSMLRRRRSLRKKRLSAEAACERWPKLPLHEASVLQTDLKIEWPFSP
jgi:hypothetical protein